MSGLALPNIKRPVGLALPTLAQAPTLTADSPAPLSATTPVLSSHTLPTPASTSVGTSAPRRASAVSDPKANSTSARVVSPSPSPEPEGDDDGDGDDDDAAGGSGSKKSKSKKKKAGGAGAGAASGGAGASGAGAAAADPTVKQEYRYSSEIAQMMFVFGEVQDPLPDTVRLVEDIVRGQIIEIITRARLLTHLRSSRFLSAEDLIFLIRDDRGKVNRLRTYLSWKDVRKRAKEDEEGGDVDMDDAEKNAAKGRKPIVKLPWELLTPFSDFLRTLPSQTGRAEEEEEEDEDEMQAYQDSMQRLRDADEITKKMTKDEYVHYSDCRQASFTYRKARRFRDFINFGAYLDVRPNDDIIDILGFLAFEMVRSLCVTALEVREQLAQSAPSASGTTSGGAGVGGVGGSNGAASSSVTRKPSTLSPSKRKATINAAGEEDDSPTKRAKVDAATIVMSPEDSTKSLPAASGSAPPPTAMGTSAGAGPSATGAASSSHPHSHSHAHTHGPARSLFAPPPSARQPLLPSHVLQAFAQIQRKQAANRVGGMRSWRGGITRGRVALI